MKVLAELSSAHEAEEILRWLSSHGVQASIEGKSSYSAGVYVPNGLTIYVHLDKQHGYALKLLRQFDNERFGEASKHSLMARLREKKLDKLFVAVATLIVVLGVLWVVSSILGSQIGI